MELNPTQTTLPQTSAVDPSIADEAANMITADFEAFLRLLTTQMENQDPLNPMSSEDLATQLATFSGVEQQVRTNQLLEDLAAGFQLSNIGNIAGWIGMEARAQMPVRYDGNPITFSFNPPDFADQSTLVVTNQDGLEVRRVQIDPSGEPMTFYGPDSNGTDLPAGTYNFAVESFANGSSLGIQPAQIYAQVREAFSRGSEVWVTLEGGAQINSVDVQGVRAPQET